jgi:hypothetical protein
MFLISEFPILLESRGEFVPRSFNFAHLLSVIGFPVSSTMPPVGIKFNTNAGLVGTRGGSKREIC